MIDQFKQHINDSFLFLKNKKLFLAVSGGLDSMVLLHLMHHLKFQIGVLHCNFGLRDDESEGDENFVRLVCNELNVPIDVKKFSTAHYAKNNKLTIQVAARLLRYEWFASKIKTENFDYVLTAHHLDDCLETFLINFTRGTGLDGLLGIPAHNNLIVRPLLPFSRETILNFAQTNLVNWREDSSNATTKYLRNKLRLQIIPLLKELQPNLLQNFSTTLKNLSQTQNLAHDASLLNYSKVVTEYHDTIEIDLKQLVLLANYKAYLYQWLHKYNFKSWHDVYQLVFAEVGKKVLSPHHVLLKSRNKLVLYKKDKPLNTAEVFVDNATVEVKYPLNIYFSDVETHTITDVNTIFVDKNILQYPLVIRKYTTNDLFYPFGLGGSKKVSKLIKEAKLSEIEKNDTWLLCSNNDVVWVINRRLDDRFKVTAKTTSILKITTQQ